MAEAEFVTDPTLNAKWNTRFAFFERFGGPSSPRYKEEFKKLPFRQKLLVNGNFFALFFGPIYFVILGLWKKALVILGIEVAVMVVMTLINVPEGLYRGIGMAFSLFYMLSANYAYYLKRVKGQDNWNPLEGMRL
jgi:hypothetical protein